MLSFQFVAIDRQYNRRLSQLSIDPIIPARVVIMQCRYVLQTAVV